MLAIAELAPGMRWILERVEAGNCPFPFGRYIDRDLEALLQRIETLQRAPIAAPSPA